MNAVNAMTKTFMGIAVLLLFALAVTFLALSRVQERLQAEKARHNATFTAFGACKGRLADFGAALSLQNGTVTALEGRIAACEREKKDGAAHAEARAGIMRQAECTGQEERAQGAQQAIARRDTKKTEVDNATRKKAALHINRAW